MTDPRRPEPQNQFGAGEGACRRVLHVTGTMNIGGAETLLMNIYRNIDRSLVQFDFLIWTDRECDYEPEIRALGGRLFRVPAPRANLYGFLRGIRETIRSAKFSAIHCHVHFWNGGCLRLARGAGVSLRISHSHTTEAGLRAGLARRTSNRLMRRLIQCDATHLLCASRSAGSALHGPQAHNDPRCRIVPNGIDMGLFQPLANRETLREQLALPKGKLLIGHVGRFHKAKNHSFLLEVFGAIRKSGHPAHLIMVGDGELREQVEREILSRRLDESVTVLGLRSDVPQLLKAFDLLLFPSIYEGLPLVVIEAQAAGTAVLASEAVPADADLQLGLLRRLKLDMAIEHWVQAAFTCMGHPVSDWNLRKNALIHCGYDIRVQASYLQSIYNHTALPTVEI
jgi:glycosyltransferase involved in cell wall biosynthesis